MKRYLLLPFLTLTAFVGGCVRDLPPADTLIVGGIVIDGTPDGGAANRVVEIVGDKIAYVGLGRERDARNVIDATGMIVSPGFIDPHTHAESILFNPDSAANEAYLRQGVTTVFIGNDGGNGRTVVQMQEGLSRHDIGTNVGLWSGHGTVRRIAMGPQARAPSQDELEEMKRLVAADMEAGALGLSSGLFYAPGSFAKTQELIELAHVAASYDGVYESHIRDESDYSVGLLGAIREAIDIGTAAQLPVHIAHIKALGPAVHGMSDAVIDMVERTRLQGLTVTADQYPWLASGTRLSNALLPRRLMSEGREAMHKSLADASLVESIREEMANNLERRGGASALLITGESEYQGQTLADVARAAGKDPLLMAVAIVRSGDPAVASFMMADEDVRAFMRQPWVVTSSDGSEGHPRKFASFPEKYARYVEDAQTLNRVEFVHRSSGLTAEIFSLCDRGRLEPGFRADVIVWDPRSYRPAATYEEPEELALGVEYLWVNGQAVIAEGKLNSSDGGRILARGECVPSD